MFYVEILTFILTVSIVVKRISNVNLVAGIVNRLLVTSIVVSGLGDIASCAISCGTRVWFAAGGGSPAFALSELHWPLAA
jgi:hypothetical protein